MVFDSSLLCLFFHYLDSFKEYRSAFCRMPLNLGLSDVFLMIGLGLWSFRKKITEAKGSSHRIIQVVEYYQVGVNSEYLLKVVSIRFLHSKVTIFPFHTSIQSPTPVCGKWRVGKIMFHLLEGGVSICTTWNCSVRKICPIFKYPLHT